MCRLFVEAESSRMRPARSVELLLSIDESASGECGAGFILEYPVMYMDPDRKLNIYMVPDHEDDILEQLNSLELPENATDPDACFRLTSNRYRGFLYLGIGGSDRPTAHFSAALSAADLR